MKESEIEELIDKFLLWFERDFTNEEVKVREYFGLLREGNEYFDGYVAGYLQCKKEI